MKKKIPLKKLIKKWFDSLPLSDEQYAKVRYFYTFHQVLNLNAPKTFNEKIHWLNLSGHLLKYTSLADKYAVREYVSKKIGNQYLNELYGLYNHETDIDFSKLPQKFVLKTTHGSHWNILCKDKSRLDENAIIGQLRKWLNMNFYKTHRETVYKNIPPRIICEKYIQDENQNIPIDYKYLCFNGQVQFMNIIFDRFTNLNGSYYDRDWKICPFNEYHITDHEIIKKPKNFEKMKEIAEALAEGIPFVRVDLYDVNSNILFGEMTFIPDAGYTKYQPSEWDNILGTYLNLPVNI